MKNKSNVLKIILIFMLIMSCSDNDDSDILVEDSGKGIERFIVASQTQRIFDKCCNGKVTGDKDKFNLLQFQGYVMPNYLSTIDVFASITSSSDVTFKYKGINIEQGQEFMIEEWFNQGSFFSIRYATNVVGEKRIVIKFRNSLGTIINLQQTVFVE